MKLALTLRRAREIFSHFAGRRILVLGDCMLDHWIWGTVSRISPEAPVPVVDVERSTCTPGGAANVVHNLCSLGASTGIIGVVGNDESGRNLRTVLQTQGADVTGLIIDEHRPTTTKTRIIANNQQVVRADTELRDAVNGKALTHILQTVGARWDAWEALLISDYNKGIIASPLLDHFMGEARQRGIPIVVGPKPENLERFSNVTILALNAKEAQAATGLSACHESGGDAAGRAILQRMQAKAVLITRGDRGMSLVEVGRKAHHVPAQARQVYDVSGAGDTVISVLTLCLAAGATLQEAVHLANLAAAVVVEKVGTATASTDEILEAMRERS